LFLCMDFLMKSCWTEALSLHPSSSGASSSFLESRSGYPQHSTPK
jgi:hypothetical protein